MNMPKTTIAESLMREVLSWEGVSAYPHRFGGTEYRVGKREIGHIHGNHMADLPFPTKVRHQLVAEGKAQPHHLLKDSGWVSFYIKGDGDLPALIDLFRQNYTLAINRGRKRPTQADGVSDDGQLS
jgi:hypothetical protein